MDKSEFEKQQWAALIRALENIIQGSIGLTEGCREVVRMGHILGMGDLKNKLFYPFLGFDSESDAFPLGEVRNLWATEGLAKLDRQREEYEARCKERLSKAAIELLEFARRQ